MTTTHDQLVSRARAAVASVDLESAASAFVAGVGTTWPRGQSVLMAYALCRHLPEHDFEPFAGRPSAVHVDHHPTASATCAVCACREVPDLDVEWTRGAIERARWSHDNIWASAVLDLEDVVAIDPLGPTADDLQVLDAVLSTLEAAPADTSPSAAEKLLGSNKVLPRQSIGLPPASRRRLVMMTLALTGVLPQPALPPRLDHWTTADDELDAWTRLGRSHRSDLMLPLAAWSGAQGVDRTRAEELFGHVR